LKKYKWTVEIDKEEVVLVKVTDPPASWFTKVRHGIGPPRKDIEALIETIKRKLKVKEHSDGVFDAASNAPYLFFEH